MNRLVFQFPGRNISGIKKWCHNGKNQLKKQQSSHLSVEEVNIQAERKKHERRVIYFGNKNHNNNFYYVDLKYIFQFNLW